MKIIQKANVLPEEGTPIDISTLPPRVPRQLQAVADDELYEITLTWLDNSDNEDGFSIERGPSPIFFTEIDTTLADVEDYLDNDIALLPETTYYYRIRAFNGNGYSAYSAIVSATTASEPEP